MKLVENKAVIAAAPADRFAFYLESHPDQQFEMPLIQDLPARQVQKLSSGEQTTEDVFDMLDGLCPGLVDIASQREISDVLAAWSDASSATLGE